MVSSQLTTQPREEDVTGGPSYSGHRCGAFSGKKDRERKRESSSPTAHPSVSQPSLLNFLSSCWVVSSSHHTRPTRRQGGDRGSFFQLSPRTRHHRCRAFSVEQCSRRAGETEGESPPLSGHPSVTPPILSFPSGVPVIINGKLNG